MKKHKKAFSLVIVPYSGEKPISITLSPAILKVVAFMLVFFVGASVLVLHSLQIYKADAEAYQRVLIENRYLQEEILFFAQTTQVLEEQLSYLQNFDMSIRDMLDLESEESDVLRHPDLEIATELNQTTTTSRASLPSRGVLGATIGQTSNQLVALQEVVPAQEQSLSTLEKAVEEHNKRMAATPSIWPTEGRITSPFGYRRSPFGSGVDFHTGVDIGATYGRPVYATAKGVVELATYHAIYGRLVVLEHGYGYSTLYAHLQRYVVAVGDAVERGDLLGYVGSTGRSTGPHLHYEVRIDGDTQNPVLYLTSLE